MDKLEQLEHLRSEDTPRRLMITHTTESYWIPSGKKTKSKLQIQRICQNFKFLNVEINFTCDTDTFWICLIRCTNMKWIGRVLLKIQSGHDSVHRRTDGQGETSIPPFNFVEAGVIIIPSHTGCNYWSMLGFKLNHASKRSIWPPCVTPAHWPQWPLWGTAVHRGGPCHVWLVNGRPTWWWSGTEESAPHLLQTSPADSDISGHEGCLQNTGTRGAQRSATKCSQCSQ